MLLDHVKRTFWTKEHFPGNENEPISCWIYRIYFLRIEMFFDVHKFSIKCFRIIWQISKSLKKILKNSLKVILRTRFLIGWCAQDLDLSGGGRYRAGRNLKPTFESRILDWSNAASNINCSRLIKPDGNVVSINVFRGKKSLFIRWFNSFPRFSKIFPNLT